MNIIQSKWILLDTTELKLSNKKKKKKMLPKNKYCSSTGCDSNTSHISNCHLCGVRELRLVIIVLSLSKYFTIICQFKYLQSWLWLVHSVLKRFFKDWWIFNSYTESSFVLISFDMGIMPFQIEISTHSSIDFLSGTASGTRNER